MKDNSKIFFDLFKGMPNIEYITVDPEIESFLWEQYSASALSSLLPQLKYINGSALILGQVADKDKESEIGRASCRERVYGLV